MALSLLTAHIGRMPVIALTALLALALLLATLWRYRWRTTLKAGVLTLAVAGVVAFLSPPDGQTSRRDRVNWQPLSEQAISDALASNKRLFIDVTADWCVTCKANKYNVLLRDDVQSALSEPDVVALARATGVARSGGDRPLSDHSRQRRRSLQSNLRTGISPGPRAVSAAQPRRTPRHSVRCKRSINHENHRCTPSAVRFNLQPCRPGRTRGCLRQRPAGKAAV